FPVAGDADHFGCSGSGSETLSKWIPLRPRAARERLVYDRNGRRLSGVGARELAPAQDLNSERAEIVGRDDVAARVDLTATRGSVERDPGPARLPRVERHMRGQTGGFDARKISDTVEQLSIELQAALALVTAHPELERHGQSVAGGEPWLARGDALE